MRKIPPEKARPPTTIRMMAVCAGTARGGHDIAESTARGWK
jgi:hypothetical protein